MCVPLHLAEGCGPYAPRPSVLVAEEAQALALGLLASGRWQGLRMPPHALAHGATTNITAAAKHFELHRHTVRRYHMLVATAYLDRQADLP